MLDHSILRVEKELGTAEHGGCWWWPRHCYIVYRDRGLQLLLASVGSQYSGHCFIFIHSSYYNAVQLQFTKIEESAWSIYSQSMLQTDSSIRADELTQHSELPQVNALIIRRAISYICPAVPKSPDETT